MWIFYDDIISLASSFLLSWFKNAICSWTHTSSAYTTISDVIPNPRGRTLTEYHRGTIIGLYQGRAALPRVMELLKFGWRSGRVWRKEEERSLEGKVLDSKWSSKQNQGYPSGVSHTWKHAYCTQHSSPLVTGSSFLFHTLSHRANINPPTLCLTCINKTLFSRVELHVKLPPWTENYKNSDVFYCVVLELK